MDKDFATGGIVNHELIFSDGSCVPISASALCADDKFVEAINRAVAEACKNVKRELSITWTN